MGRVKLNYTFLKKKMDGKYVHEKFSSSLIVKELQINTMRYYLTTERMSHIKEIWDQSVCGDIMEKKFIHFWWEYFLVQSLWETGWRSLIKVIMELLISQLFPFSRRPMYTIIYCIT